eukprot:gb/GFBE01060676.1/.p1 GENE.gb/GFBE01060676.1/~~gb/GFBE01060676.1/.p1  ORF type:complete len:742 (+),score=86.23 gb/GFBE01060676.1/:1-2226(+)
MASLSDYLEAGLNLSIRRWQQLPMVLSTTHVMGQYGQNHVVPMSYWGCLEEMDATTSSGAVPVAQTPRSCEAGANHKRSEHAAWFDGSSVLVDIQQRASLELPVMLTSIMVTVGRKLSSIALVENREDVDSSGNPAIKILPNRCWLFYIDRGKGNLNNIVNLLLAAGAILTDSVELPRTLSLLSKGEDSSVYLATVKPFFQQDELPSQNRLSFLSAIISEESSHISQSHSSTSGGGGVRGAVRNPFDSPQDDGGTPLLDASSRSQQDGARSSALEEPPISSKSGGSPVSEDLGLQTMKFYHRKPGDASRDDEDDGPMMLPDLGDDLPIEKTFPEDKIANELRALALAQGHKHVLKLHGLVQEHDPVTLVLGWTMLTEYCAGGSLLAHMKERGKLSEPDAVRHTYQLLTGLAHMHERGIIHRDVKLDHCLLREGNQELVLAGFSSACRLSDHKRCESPAGTLGYMAPEVIQFNHWEEAADIFSAGIVLYSAISGQKPFGGSTPAELTKHSTIHKEVDFGRHKAFKNVSEEYKIVVRELLQKSLDVRPSARAAMREALFKDVAGSDCDRAGLQRGSGSVRTGKEGTGSIDDQVPSSSSAMPKASAASAGGVASAPADPSPNAVARPQGQYAISAQNDAVAGATPGPVLQRPANQASVSWATRIRERTGRMLPGLPFSGARGSRNEETAAFTNVSPSGQGASQADTPVPGRGSAATRALSTLRSMLPRRGAGGQVTEQAFSQLH